MNRDIKVLITKKAKYAKHDLSNLLKKELTFGLYGLKVVPLTMLTNKVKIRKNLDIRMLPTEVTTKAEKKYKRKNIDYRLLECLGKINSKKVSMAKRVLTAICITQTFNR